MKNNLKRIGLLIGLACMVLCVALLAGCIGKSGDNGKQPTNTELQATTPVTENAPATDAPVATEEPTEESTEPTEESTEPTEETEPEEEEEDSSAGGNSTPGGTGGFTGSEVPDVGTGDEEETKPTEPEVLEVDAPGTVNNAYTEFLSVGEETEVSVGSVMIPVEGEIFYNFYQANGMVLNIEDADAYVVYDGNTYEADENGLVMVKLTAVDEVTPVSVQLGNKSDAEEIYTMKFAAPMGTMQNPEVLEDIASMTVKLNADYPDGYYYSWTAEFNCNLAFRVESVTPEEVQYDVSITVGEQTVSLADSADGTISVDLLTGDEAIIHVAVTPAETEAEVVLAGTVSGAPGSVTNPYEEDMEGRESFETALIPAESYVHYNVYNVGGMTLTIENENAYVMYDNVTYGADAQGIVNLRIPAAQDAEAPVELVFGNNSDAELSYTVSFVYPQGGEADPEILETLGSATASVSSDYEGYYYSWTADQTGVLSVNVMEVLNLTDSSADVTYDVTVNNLTKASAMSLSTDGWLSGGVYPTVSNLVEIGDEVQIIVTVSGGERATVAQITSVTSVSGTSDVMFSITNGTVKIPAASWIEVYAHTREGEQILTVHDAADLKLIINGEEYGPDGSGVIKLVTPESDPRHPVEIKLVSTSQAAKTYTMTFEYPLGHMYNPEQLKLGQTSVNVPEGNDDGYCYTWTAEDDGILTIQVGESYLKLANMTLSNQSNYDTVNLWDMNTVTNPMTMEISAGQEVILNITSRNSSYPAVDLVIEASFEAAYGSTSNPVILENGENTITVPSGKTWYCSADAVGLVATISGADLTVVQDGEVFTSETGELSVTITESGIFGITNNSESDADYVISIDAPVGTEQNPEAVDSVSYLICTIPAGTDSYYYSWTSDSEGVLSAVMMNEAVEGYDVSIRNITSGVEFTQSADGWVNGFGYPVVSNLVSAGDELLIGIRAGDAAEESEITLSCSVSGSEELMLYMSSNHVRIPLISGHTVYAYTRIGEQMLTIHDAADLTLTIKGVSYSADANGVISLFTPETDMNNPLEIMLVSTSDVAKTYSLDFEYLLGHLENPEALKPGNVLVQLPAGQDEGYYYTWTAPSDGELSVAVEDTKVLNATLIHQGNYETVSVWDSNKPVSPITMSVSAGDVVYLNVVAHSASYPAVESAVTVSFVSSEPAPVQQAAAREEEPEGTEENPLELKDKDLEKVEVSLEAESVGYYYTWKATEEGTLTFVLDEENELKDIRANITLINQRTEEEVTLWEYDEQEEAWTENENVSMEVRKGDEVLILVTATEPVDSYDEDAVISCLEAEFIICGEFIAREEEPVQTVQIPEEPVQEIISEEVTEEVNPGEEEIVAEPAEEETTEQAEAVEELPAEQEPIATEPEAVQETEPQSTEPVSE
ncbi:MAG: hypothetical protein J6B95_01865 [Oscillospiraceae bacterium]|nr:hypothetical protein [Oscillospiraceae bacterium]